MSFTQHYENFQVTVYKDAASFQSKYKLRKYKIILCLEYTGKWNVGYDYPQRWYSPVTV